MLQAKMALEYPAFQLFWYEAGLHVSFEDIHAVICFYHYVCEALKAVPDEISVSGVQQLLSVLIGQEKPKRFPGVMLRLEWEYSPCPDPELLPCLDDIGPMPRYLQRLRRARRYVAIYSGTHDVLYGFTVVKSAHEI